MRYRLPPLSTLRLFEASARLLSFKNAAEELLLTPSAVSHGIQSLEEWLGAELFVRMTRGLALSDAGEMFYPIVRDALGMIAAGTSKIAGRQGGKQLSISVAPTFAARWLLPRLPKFRDRHPDIGIMIDTAHDRVGLEDTEVDLAIRMGRGDWQELMADRLVTEELVPVCSPSIAERVRELSDMEQAPLIHVTTVSDDWATWAAAAGRKAPDPTRGLRFDTLQMAFDAAVQGLGVVIGRKPLVNAELDDGRLVELWQPVVTSRTSYWLVGAPARADEPTISAFRSWLVEEAASGDHPSPSQ